MSEKQIESEAYKESKKCVYPNRAVAVERLLKSLILKLCLRSLLILYHLFCIRWLDVGSGDLGKIYVEIIGADGLPNKDHDLGTGNKTDSFISVVYEDCIAKTDVIDDCLSPRWLPWTQRAFIFRMMHTSSNLHVAVFDYDAGFSNDHDICGRVSIDLANLNSGVVYLLVRSISCCRGCRGACGLHLLFSISMFCL